MTNHKGLMDKLAVQERFEKIEERLEALEAEQSAHESQIDDLDDKVKFLMNQLNRVEALEQLNKSTPPSEKGVWVTRKRLAEIYYDTFSFTDLAKRLGLGE